MADLIFLTGHRKAGTTLLHTLFDGHPDLLVYPTDVSILYAYYPAFALDKNLSDHELRRRLTRVIGQSLSRVSPADTAVAQENVAEEFLRCFWDGGHEFDLRDMAELLGALADAWCRYSGVPPSEATCVLKETSQSVHLTELLASHPNLRMVQIVRDPRDNYAALKAGVTKYYSQMGEGEYETLASAINRCRMDMMAAEINRTTYPDNFYVLRFEDLVNDPQKEVDALCAFLGIRFDPVLLRPTKMGRHFSGNSHEGDRFHGIEKAKAGAWQKRIRDDEARIIEHWCATEMSTWGYTPCFSPSDRQASFSAFYKWYNTRYFYQDSFQDSFAD